MFETCVQMVLSSKVHDVLKMSVVNVSVYSEQPFENHLHNIYEILWECNSDLTREQMLIVQLILDPSHQEINVFAR